MKNSHVTYSDRIVDALFQHGDVELLRMTAEKILQRLKHTRANVEHASDLSKVEQQQIESFIHSNFPSVTEITFTSTPELLGGIRIHYGDYIYDDSVKGRLQKLKGQQ